MAAAGVVIPWAAIVGARQSVTSVAFAADMGTPFSRLLSSFEPLGESAPPPGMLERLPDGMREKLPDELVDELLAGASSEEEIVGPGGVLSQLTKRLVERAMEVELTDHLGLLVKLPCCRRTSEERQFGLAREEGPY